MMKEKPLVSIIVPIYNTEPFLEKCINSLIRQTYSNLEILLIDDGSPDRCPDMCDAFSRIDPRIVVIHKPNGGLSDARNAGLDKATGDYISFVDSDDYLETDAISVLVHLILSGDYAIAHMKNRLIDNDYKIVLDQSNNTYEVVSYSADEYIQGMCEKKLSESVCDKLFSSSLFSNRRFEKGRLNEDFFFLAQLLMDGYETVEIDYSGYNYYQRLGSITKAGFAHSLVDSVKNAYELKQIAREKYPAMERHFARLTLFQARTVFITIPWEYVKKNRSEYRETLAFMRGCIPFLPEVSLSIIDKTIITLVNASPQISIFLLTRIWKIKNTFA